MLKTAWAASLAGGRDSEGVVVSSGGVSVGACTTSCCCSTACPVSPAPEPSSAYAPAPRRASRSSAATPAATEIRRLTPGWKVWCEVRVVASEAPGEPMWFLTPRTTVSKPLSPALAALTTPARPADPTPLKASPAPGVLMVALEAAARRGVSRGAPSAAQLLDYLPTHCARKGLQGPTQTLERLRRKRLFGIAQGLLRFMVRLD